MFSSPCFCDDYQKRRFFIHPYGWNPLILIVDALIEAFLLCSKIRQFYSLIRKNTIKNKQFFEIQLEQNWLHCPIIGIPTEKGTHDRGFVIRQMDTVDKRIIVVLKHKLFLFLSCESKNEILFCCFRLPYSRLFGQKLQCLPSERLVWS